MPTTGLHFMHYSGNTFMPPSKWRQDVDRIAAGNHHWVTMTETADPATLKLIRDVVGDRMQVINPDAGDITFLVHPDIPAKNATGELVIPRVTGKAADGGHGPRFNSSVELQVGPADITVFGVHFVTLKSSAGPRFTDQQKQASTLGSSMRTAGAGPKLAIGSGDLNGVLPNRTDIQKIFDLYGLTTTAQETGDKDPTEGGRRIDYAWTRDADSRVNVTRMVVHHGAKWNTDHDPLDVWATVLDEPSSDHKLWVPGGIRKPIAKTTSDPFIIPVGGIFHIAVSNALSLFDLFEHDGGIESTGYVRLDGTFEQYRPLNVQCDAQFDGNSFARADGKLYGFNSWESQGGVPDGGGMWTDPQLATIKEIIRFSHDQWGNPLRLAPAWDADGFGYHRLYQRWNKTNHSCPGPERVRQFNEVIVPWLKGGGR